MTTYREQLARQHQPEPTRYISNEDYRRQKSALTRAKNSGDPIKVLRAVEKAVEEWRGLAWPDNWARWRVALEDAAADARRQGDYETCEELRAAALVLFAY